MEGRAASDDEEDNRGSRLEVKKHVSRLHSCGKGLASFQDSHSPSPPGVNCHSSPSPDVRTMRAISFLHRITMTTGDAAAVRDKSKSSLVEAKCLGKKR